MEPLTPFPSAAPRAQIYASPGQRPGLPARVGEALKGRPNRKPMIRPFRAGSSFSFSPGALPRAFIDRAFGPAGLNKFKTLAAEAQPAWIGSAPNSISAASLMCCETKNKALLF